ncbi:hypothetical protein CTAYLR_009136 [Chrysophaeum taylorii]|uniref:Tyrosinase copper-binding domain-containing protein n=1 Tax=Chrysophaeum taylorii TaxID=2483200 RepID=A0AAD7XQG7_9STRA|nr:hypothetical protein CTAYLR_009136 [Chrysophaeum taylorii]
MPITRYDGAEADDMCEALSSPSATLVVGQRQQAAYAKMVAVKDEAPNGWPCRRVCGAALMALSVPGFLAFVAKYHEDSMTSVMEAPATRYELCVTTEYERRTGYRIGDGLYPHGHIAQVRAPNRLELRSPSDDEGTLSWRWRVTGFKSDITVVDSVATVENDDGKSAFDVVFPHVGAYRVVATWEDVSVNEIVHARVVRRELRTLTSADRERYLSALHAVYAVDQAAGIKKYGRMWKSADWLVREHLYGASSIECDHWHDDAGMLQHHVGITWQLENSLRLVDDSTAAHWWDYTIDAADYGSSWARSPIFSDDWFGTASPHNPDHVLDTGRFAFTRVLLLSGTERFASVLANPYGLLRSPWNTNKIPFLLRYNRTLGALTDGYRTPPTCSLFASWLREPWLGRFLLGINGALHGPVHIMIGGLWTFETSKWTEALSSRLQFPDAFLLLGKFLWRQGYARCPTACSSDTRPQDCVCSCPAAIMRGRNATVFLEDAGVTSLNPNANLADLLSEFGLSDQDYLEELCRVGHPGEMFTSAAPQDPTFWPLHGNQERFIQYARLLKHRGFLNFSEHWGYAHANQNPSDTGVVCDWSSVDAGTFDMPKCAAKTCPGHRAEDLLPFEDLHLVNLPGEVEDELDVVDGTTSAKMPVYYTNLEFYEATNPLAMQLPYVYDSVSRWPACGGNGDLLSSM